MVMVTDSELYNVLGMTLVTDIVSLLTATLLVHSTSYFAAILLTQVNGQSFSP